VSFYESIIIALNNVWANKLRATLTLLIIAFGIAALVGILTAIDSAIFSMTDSFSSLGSNSFTIRPKMTEVSSTVRGRKIKRSEPITYKQAMKFKDRFDMNGRVSVSFRVNSNSTVKYKEEQTNPVISLFGVDENEIYARGHNIEHGRFFNEKDINHASHLTVIGMFIAKTLFNDQAEKAVGKVILINGKRFKVAGVLEEEGSSMNQNSDKKIMIPVTLAKHIYGTERTYYSISVSVSRVDNLDAIISESIGLMRNARGLKAKEENDFEIGTSEGLQAIIKDNTTSLRMGAIIIGIITLFGAAIGLMNIMLVSVTERTKEIGIIKAIGATRQAIINQFLIEAVIICQMGGILGIILGMFAGNSVSLIFGGDFVVPWAWIILGIVLCTIVGLISGLYPALKAARLDPIESLRYE
jgi:putative ABC transport system permease protein